MNEEPKVESPVAFDERRGATSASNAYADSLCPGRHLAQRGKPELEGSVQDQDFGTAIHVALATGDTSKLSPQQLNIYEMCDAIASKAIEDYFGPEAQSVKRFIEQRFWVKIDGKFEHSAKPDLAVRAGDKALIIEFKSLTGVVASSERNAQLRDQVVLGGRHMMVKKVGGVVAQPLVTMTPQTVEYNEEAINIAEREMFDRVRASNDPNSPRIAGRSQCQFCKAKIDCPQYLEMVALAAPTKPLHELAALAVASWTPEQRAQAAEQIQIASKWIESVKNSLKAQLVANPESIPGWRLEEGSVKRPINDVATLHSRFVALGGKTEDLLACVDVSKGDLEAKVRAATNTKGKGLKAEMDKLLEGITEEKQDAPSLSRIKQ